MAVGLNTSTDIGQVLNLIGEYIFGDPQLVGVWIIILFIGLGLSFDLDFTLVLVFLIPVTVALLAFSMINPVFGGAILIFDAFILATNFIFKR